jgi:hypothetical protein
MNLPNSFVYNRMERTDGGIRPIINTFGATSPGISISLISAIMPKNETSSVKTKKNTIATRKPTILTVVLGDSVTSAMFGYRRHRYNMLMNQYSEMQRAYRSKRCWQLSLFIEDFRDSAL